MGLDMYLYAKRYYSNYSYNAQGQVTEVPLPTMPGVPEGYGVRYVTCEVTYWRKANQIHEWFVQNVQGGNDDCGTYSVERQQLRELVNLCKQVLADMSKAPELLPTEEGFFFGSTEYGDYYKQDLEETVAALKKALAAFPDGKWDFEYTSSW